MTKTATHLHMLILSTEVQLNFSERSTSALWLSSLEGQFPISFIWGNFISHCYSVPHIYCALAHQVVGTLEISLLNILQAILLSEKFLSSCHHLAIILMFWLLVTWYFLFSKILMTWTRPQARHPWSKWATLCRLPVQSIQFC